MAKFLRKFGVLGILFLSGSGGTFGAESIIRVGWSLGRMLPHMVARSGELMIFLGKLGAMQEKGEERQVDKKKLEEVMRCLDEAVEHSKKDVIRGSSIGPVTRVDLKIKNRNENLDIKGEEKVHLEGKSEDLGEAQEKDLENRSEAFENVYIRLSDLTESVCFRFPWLEGARDSSSIPGDVKKEITDIVNEVYNILKEYEKDEEWSPCVRELGDFRFVSSVLLVNSENLKKLGADGKYLDAVIVDAVIGGLMEFLGAKRGDDPVKFGQSVLKKMEGCYFVDAYLEGGGKGWGQGKQDDE